MVISFITQAPGAYSSLFSSPSLGSFFHTSLSSTTLPHAYFLFFLSPSSLFYLSLLSYIIFSNLSFFTFLSLSLSSQRLHSFTLPSYHLSISEFLFSHSPLFLRFLSFAHFFFSLSFSSLRLLFFTLLSVYPYPSLHIFNQNCFVRT